MYGNRFDDNDQFLYSSDLPFDLFGNVSTGRAPNMNDIPFLTPLSSVQSQVSTSTVVAPLSTYVPTPTSAASVPSAFMSADTVFQAGPSLIPRMMPQILVPQLFGGQNFTLWKEMMIFYQLSVLHTTRWICLVGSECRHPTMPHKRIGFKRTT